MVDILQRFQAGEDDSALPANAAEEEDEEGGVEHGDLSDETIAKLIAKVGLSPESLPHGLYTGAQKADVCACGMRRQRHPHALLQACMSKEDICAAG